MSNLRPSARQKLFKRRAGVTAASKAIIVAHYHKAQALFDRVMDVEQVAGQSVGLIVEVLKDQNVEGT